MKQGNVDVEALEASLNNIRSMFVTSVSGKEELKVSYQAKIDNIKNLKDKLEAELTEKIVEAREEKALAETKAEEATKAMEQAFKDLKVAEEKATCYLQKIPEESLFHTIYNIVIPIALLGLWILLLLTTIRDKTYGYLRL